MNHKHLPLISALAIMTASTSAYAELKNFNVSGLVETEVSFTNSDSNGDSSDIAVPTVELAIETTFSEQVSANIVLLAEDIGTADQTDVTVDEATLSLPLGGATLTIGQTTVPFGSYESSGISDPLTLTLGETAETVIMYGREMESGLSYSAYVFSGDTLDSSGEKKINDLGFNIAMTQDAWSAGIGYISNIADSDTIGDIGATITDDIAGLDLNASFNTGAITILFEHVMAMDDFVAGDLGQNDDTPPANNITATAQPSATHIEVSMDLGGDSSIALSLSSSDEAAEFGLYENATAVIYSATVREHLGYAVEFMQADEYGSNSDTIVTVQMALEF